MKKTAQLHNWTITEYADGVYVAYGVVQKHHSQPDNLKVRTSRILRIDFEKKEMETLNTIYALGESSDRAVQTENTKEIE